MWLFCNCIFTVSRFDLSLKRLVKWRRSLTKENKCIPKNRPPPICPVRNSPLKCFVIVVFVWMIQSELIFLRLPDKTCFTSFILQCPCYTSYMYVLPNSGFLPQPKDMQVRWIEDSKWSPRLVCITDLFMDYLVLTMNIATDAGMALRRKQTNMYLL